MGDIRAASRRDIRWELSPGKFIEDNPKSILQKSDLTENIH